MATEQEVFEAGGQKCIQQNLNIAFVFWALANNSSSNQTIVKNIIEFIKGLLLIYAGKRFIEIIMISSYYQFQIVLIQLIHFLWTFYKFSLKY